MNKKKIIIKAKKTQYKVYEVKNFNYWFARTNWEDIS